MNRTLSKLKEDYNVLIARNDKAEEYLNKCTEEEFNKWLPLFRQIIIDLSSLMKEYKEITGKEMSEENAINGFR